MSSRHGTVPTSTQSFNIFFEGWLARQQSFLNLLQKSQQQQQQQESATDQLIEQVLGHYGEYYEEKSRIIRLDIFLVFSPSWLTSFEKAFLWVAGFKPSLIFRLLEISVSNMVSEQVQMLQRLKRDTVRQERETMDAFAAIQESMGAPPMMDLARRVGRLVDGEACHFADAINELKEAMVRVVERADNLRRCTVMKAAEILNREQTVEFLVGVAKYQLGVRAWGIQKDSQRG